MSVGAKIPDKRDGRAYFGVHRLAFDMTTESHPVLGQGIYSVSDVAHVLRLPYHQVHRVLNVYWEARAARYSEQVYSWTVDGSKAVDFLVLIEFHTFFRLRAFGARTKAILDAHEQLCLLLGVHHPFAHQRVLRGLGTSGRKIVFESPEGIVDLDATRQINLDFVRDFVQKLEFGKGDLAERYWPLGRERHIVLDPHRHFGQATIAGTSIQAEIVAGMVQAGDTVELVARTYGITIDAVQDAMRYVRRVA